MSIITVYEKPTCTTCKNLATLLREKGIDYDEVNYFIEPFTADRLQAVIAKTGLRPFDILRKREPAFKESGFTQDTPDDEVIAAMIENPNLIQRPIVEVGDSAVLARPVEKALDLLRSE